MCESGSNATSLPPTQPTVLRLPITTPPFGAVMVAGSDPTPALIVTALLALLLLYSVTGPEPKADAAPLSVIDPCTLISTGPADVSNTICAPEFTTSDERLKLPLLKVSFEPLTVTAP